MLAKRNYKVYTNIWITRRDMQLFMTILKTEAGSSFIRKEMLPPFSCSLIHPLLKLIHILDAGNRHINIIAVINFTVQPRTRLEIVTFKVVEKLAADVIIGCDFFDKDVYSIQRRKRSIEHDYGMTFSTVRKPMKRHKYSVPQTAA